MLGPSTTHGPRSVVYCLVTDPLSPFYGFFDAKSNHFGTQTTETRPQSKPNSWGRLSSCSPKANVLIFRATGISRRRLCIIREAHISNEHDTLNKVMDLEENRARHRLALSKNEYELIKARIKYAARHDITVGIVTAKHTMGYIADKERDGFQNGIWSDDTIKAWYARISYVSMRKFELKHFPLVLLRTGCT